MHTVHELYIYFFIYLNTAKWLYIQEKECKKACLVKYPIFSKFVQGFVQFVQHLNLKYLDAGKTLQKERDYASASVGGYLIDVMFKA